MSNSHQPNQPHMAAVVTLPPGDDPEAGAHPLRRPPHNIEAEKSLLGAIFANNKAYEQVSEYLLPAHFALAQHGRIYAAAAKLIERGQIADSITLQRYFEQDESLLEIGGSAYLDEITTSAVTVINAAEYGRIIHDRHLRRELIGLGTDVVNSAFDERDVDITAMDQIESAERHLYDLATSGDIEGGFQEFNTTLVQTIALAERAHKSDGGLSGVTTGFRDLDEMLGGLHETDLVILAGRPAMGKTALATNISYAAAKAHLDSNGREGAVVGFFSMEMAADQLGARIVCEQARISSDAMRRGKLSNDEFSRLVHTSQRLDRMPFFIDDTAGLSVSALRTRARRLKRQHKLGLIVVDYIQLITDPLASRHDGRVNEVSAITRGLKILAKELRVPVLALSQLSRNTENREDKRPQLADLRESGSIEQDADVVAFIYRDEYYLEKAEPKRKADETGEKYAARVASWEDRMEDARNVAEVIIGKQRHGPVGTVRLQFQGAFTRFGDLDRDHSQDALL